MLYLDIIINEFKGIILLDNYLHTALFISFIIFFFLLYRKLYTNSSTNKYIIIIRLIIVILLLPLINNKIFTKHIDRLRDQNVVVVLDNSISMKNILNLNKLNLTDQLEKIQSWSKEKNINLIWHNLDTVISSYNSLAFDKQNTSFSNIKNISQKHSSDQIIIVSDGRVNKDYISSNLSINHDNKIHTIGVGPSKNNFDVGIYDVKINSHIDSTLINVTFNVDINDDNKFTLNILSDDIIKKIDTLNIKKGKYFFEKSYKIDPKDYTNNIKLFLDTYNVFDMNTYNNEWIVKNPMPTELRVLLISNSLSYNTMLIKDILSTIDFLEYEHIYNISENFNLFKLDINSYDAFILDNFPNHENDFIYMNEIYNEDKYIFFMEGYDFNPQYIIEFLNDKMKTEFSFEDNLYLKSANVNNALLSNISSQYNIYSKSNKNNYELMYFNDNSIYQINKSNFLGLFIPNLAETSFFLKNKYNDTSIEQYVKYLIDKHIGINSHFNVKLNKKNYLVGEKLKINVYNNSIYKHNKQKIVIKEINKNISDTINFLKDSEIILSNPGNYEIYSFYKGTNSNLINSNIEKFIVEDISLEIFDNTQNKDFLKAISNRYDGYYTDIMNLSNDWLSDISNDRIMTSTKELYSALEIFIKERIFLIIIFLFCFEIYLRKKTGLL